MSRFGKTWLTVALAVPSLMMLGLAVYAVRSGNIGSIWQSGNMASVVLIVSFLLVCSVWFLYRDYLATKNLNAEPATLHLRWSWPKVFLICLPLFPIVLLLVFFVTEFSGQIAASGFLAFAGQPISTWSWF